MKLTLLGLAVAVVVCGHVCCEGTEADEQAAAASRAMGRIQQSASEQMALAYTRMTLTQKRIGQERDEKLALVRSGAQRGRVLGAAAAMQAAAGKSSKRARAQSCFLKYCNANADLKKVFCGGKPCKEMLHAKKCERHWKHRGQKERRAANPESCCKGRCSSLGGRAKAFTTKVKNAFRRGGRKKRRRLRCRKRRRLSQRKRRKCKDLVKYCAIHKANGACTKPKALCKDSARWAQRCSGFLHQGKCHRKHSWHRRVCRKTCGACEKHHRWRTKCVKTCGYCNDARYNTGTYVAPYIGKSGLPVWVENMNSRKQKRKGKGLLDCPAASSAPTTTCSTEFYRNMLSANGSCRKVHSAMLHGGWGTANLYPCNKGRRRARVRRKAGVCKDLVRWCASHKANSACKKTHPNRHQWRTKCVKTCGYCDDARYNTGIYVRGTACTHPIGGYHTRRGSSRDDTSRDAKLNLLPETKRAALWSDADISKTPRITVQGQQVLDCGMSVWLKKTQKIFGSSGRVHRLLRTEDVGGKGQPAQCNANPKSPHFWGNPRSNCALPQNTTTGMITDMNTRVFENKLFWNHLNWRSKQWVATCTCEKWSECFAKNLTARLVYDGDGAIRRSGQGHRRRDSKSRYYTRLTYVAMPDNMVCRNHKEIKCEYSTLMQHNPKHSARRGKLELHAARRGALAPKEKDLALEC